jgi:hypothetical protein
LSHLITKHSHTQNSPVPHQPIKESLKDYSTNQIGVEA